MPTLNDYQELTRNYQAKWERCRIETEAVARTELLEFFDTDIINCWGLPLQNGRHIIPVDSSFGWTQRQLDGTLAAFPPEVWPTMPLCGNIRDFPVALLSFPGALTYGHWIIDIPARLEILSQHCNLERLKFVVPGPIHEWFIPFLSAYGIGREQLLPIGSDDRLHAEHLLVPGLLRINDYLPEFPHSSSLKKLRAFGLEMRRDQPKSSGALLWVRHVSQTSVGHRATLSNGTEIESALHACGFKSITPSEMSLADQILTFGSARVIVGEDSSAMHNVVWSEGASMVVLASPSRYNLLHLSLAHTLESKCLYIRGVQRTETEFSVNPLDVLSAVEYVS